MACAVQHGVGDRSRRLRRRLRGALGRSAQGALKPSPRPLLCPSALTQTPLDEALRWRDRFGFLVYDMT